VSLLEAMWLLAALLGRPVGARAARQRV
jgi:hypothetical protein